MPLFAATIHYLGDSFVYVIYKLPARVLQIVTILASSKTMK